MSKDQDRIVFRNKNGKWVNKKNSSSKATSLHDTQKEAENEAKRFLRKQGGGELITKGLDGKIRSKDTIKPGNDPIPPKDREH